MTPRLAPGWIRGSLVGLALAVDDLVGILVGFAVFKLTRVPDQLLVQAPAAALFVLVDFTLATAMLARNAPRLVPAGRTEWTIAYVAAFAWTAIIFVPLHFLARGYLTSVGNIIATWAFELPVNLAAVAAASWAAGRATRPPGLSSPSP